MRARRIHPGKYRRTAVEAILDVDEKGRGAPSLGDFARADPCSLPNRPSLPQPHTLSIRHGRRGTGHGCPVLRFREIAVKTATLRALEKSLEDERYYLETSALLVSGQRQEDNCCQRARRITSIVACLRTE